MSTTPMMVSPYFPDEDELRRKAIQGGMLGGQPNGAGMAPKPTTLGAIPPEPTQLMGATPQPTPQDNGPYREPDSGLVRRGAGAKFDPQSEYQRQVQMGAPTPQTAAPDTRNKVVRGLESFGAGLLGGYPELKNEWNRNQVQADQTNATQLGAYNSRLGELKGAADEQSQQELRTAQEEKDRADAIKAMNPPAVKSDNVQQLYAAAVADAQSRGVDPNKDPKVMQLSDAITSLQKQPATPADKAPKTIEMGSSTYQWDESTDTWKKIGAGKATAAEPGSFMPLYDKQGNVAGAWDAKSGRVVKAPELPQGATTAQGAGIGQKSDAAQAANNKFQQHVQLANEAGKNISGPGDYTIMMAFVDATKPSSGFRFTDAERKVIEGTRGTVEGIQAKIKSATDATGPFLAPQQRNTMLQIINSAANAAKGSSQPNAGGGMHVYYDAQGNRVTGQ